MGGIMKEIEQKDFVQETKEGVVLVDFFATWCGPCRMMAQILEDIDKEFDGKAKIIKVDVDKNEDLARTFGVMSIPTLLIFKDGIAKEKHVGVWMQHECVEAVKKYL